MKFNGSSIKYFFLFFIASVFLVLLFQSQSYRFKPAAEIPEEFKQELFDLGKQALASGDVPVASIVTYDGKIIGRGFNTVKRDHNIGGHAEINAVSDAFKLYGEKFAHLDRKKLTLYSTFEPCEMCKGALMHYNITKAVFEKKKPVWEQVAVTMKSVLYDLRKQRFTAPALQDSLFDLAR